MDILVWKNKYDDRYLDASTDEALELSAQSILRELLQDGWIPKPDPVDFDEEELEVLAMSEEQLEELPKSVRESVESEIQSLKRRQAIADEYSKEYEDAQAVLYGTAPEVCIRRKAKYSEEDWAKILKASKNWFGAVEREDGIYRKPSAWSILQSRDGAEYENYSLCTVESPKRGE